MDLGKLNSLVQVDPKKVTLSTHKSVSFSLNSNGTVPRKAKTGGLRPTSSHSLENLKSPYSSQIESKSKQFKRPDVTKPGFKSGFGGKSGMKQVYKNVQQVLDSIPTDVMKTVHVDNSEVKMSRNCLSSEEEVAKARIADKRRSIRAQKERDAEMERLRLEEIIKHEMELYMKELLVEIIESVVIAHEVKKANEEEMKKVKNKDADEKNAKDEMERVGVNEELLKKAKLEAEVSQKRFIEMMKKEETERSARKKRVEEIMTRTRKKEKINYQRDLMSGFILGRSDKPDLLQDIPCVDGVDYSEVVSNGDCSPPLRPNVPLYEKNAANCDPSSSKSLEMIRMRRYEAVINLGSHEDLKLSERKR